ncbi:pilus assembly protein PilM [Nocardioides sp. GY 10127]|uniref:pilus assembly protein PilM n=1 Tax=Nocardioides sp. GY 10127 TaxID=2569762 RepID=UPI001458CF5B|nr:pilus assembly protein PilM [Nocardioides sp. GY 10127]
MSGRTPRGSAAPGDDGRQDGARTAGHDRLARGGTDDVEVTAVARTVVGLEIGTDAVRAVEVRRSRRGATVRRSGRVPLPRGAVDAGQVREPAPVVAALRQLWAEQKFGTRDVRLAVGSASVLVRRLELDWMSEEDLRRSLRFQVADLLPVPVDDANLDHVPLGEGEVVDEVGRARRVSRILLVATAKESVDGLVRCAHAARLSPVAADLSAFAALRALRDPVAGTPAEAGSTTPPSVPTLAVVDVGANTVTVTVGAPAGPRFVRVAAGLGGDLVTRALVEHTGRSWAEAEEVKAEPGLLPPVGAHPTGRDQTVALEAVTRMVGEVRATLDFSLQNDPAHTPASLLLTGGGSRMPGLADHLAAALRVPVAVRGADPGSRDGVPDHLLAPLGLCLGSAA